MTATEPREIRGLAILALGNQIQRIDSHSYRVASQTGRGDYLVVCDENEWMCGCPDNTFRQVACKHIIAVLASQRIREEVAEDLTLSPASITGCPNCGSSHINKWGYRYSKKGVKRAQRLKCLDCGARFTNTLTGFERMQANPHAVTVALDLYFKGVSLRKITDHLKQFERLNVSHMAVQKWIRKYISLMKTYVDTIKPANLSGVFHADEMKINVNGSWVYLWNLMDSDTRFMLAMRVAKGRTAADAEAVFRETKEQVGTPKVLINDGLASYNPAFERVFGEGETIHLAGVGIRSPISNNRIERFHSTYRERTKVMRAFDNLNGAQAISDGERLYQNFLRPHSALQGKTPAEAAGIDLKLKGNRWQELIAQASRSAQ